MNRLITSSGYIIEGPDSDGELEINLSDYDNYVWFNCTDLLQMLEMYTPEQIEEARKTRKENP